MGKNILFVFIISFVFCVSSMFAQDDDSAGSTIDIPVVPIDLIAIPISPAVPTIPDIDPMHAPKIRSNIFGIDLGQYIGDSEITVRTTFKTKHKWYGQDWFDDKGAQGYGVNYRLPLIEGFPGRFYFDVINWSQTGTGSYSSDAAKQNNYKVYYVNDFFEEETYHTQVTISETYYDLLDADMGDDGQEFGIGLSFPGFFDWGRGGKLVPSFYAGKVWNLKLDRSGGYVNEYDGSVYTPGLDYYRKLGESITADIYVKLNYSEGFDTSDNEFTDVTVGLLTDFEVTNGIVITPSVNYVHYLDDTLLNGGRNDGDVWTGLSIRYNF
jgi:hypothetical protein